MINTLLGSEDAVVSIRALEMLTVTGNKVERLYSVFQKAGYIKKGLDLYIRYADDILEKLNLVDIISKMGTT